MLLCLLEIILIETLHVAYSSISDDYLQPYGDCNWFFFFYSCGGVGGQLHVHIAFSRPRCLPLKGLINQLLGECWRAIGIVSI